MTLPFLDFLIILASTQGLVLSAVLWFSTTVKLANRLLSALLFLIAIAGLGLSLWNFDAFGYSLVKDIITMVPFIIIMPIGPLIYFYVRAYAEQEFKWDFSKTLHFLPVIIDVLPSILVIGGFSTSSSIDQYNVLADIPRWLSLSIYLVFTFLYLEKLKSGINASGKSFQWLGMLLKILIGFQLIWLCYLIPYVMPATTNWVLENFSWYPVYIPLAMLIYFLSFKGYLMAHLLPDLESRRVKALSGVTNTMAKDIQQKLVEAMEIRMLYLSPQLTINILADSINENPKIISAVLNNHLDLGFNDFVNGYRISRVQEKLLLKEYEKFNITQIAYECGFNSQPTFQRAFKQVTGMTPTEYQKKACKAPKIVHSNPDLASMR